MKDSNKYQEKLGKMKAPINKEMLWDKISQHDEFPKEKPTLGKRGRRLILPVLAALLISTALFLYVGTQSQLVDGISTPAAQNEELSKDNGQIGEESDELNITKLEQTMGSVQTKESAQAMNVVEESSSFASDADASSSYDARLTGREAVRERSKSDAEIRNSQYDDFKDKTAKKSAIESIQLQKNPDQNSSNIEESDRSNTATKVSVGLVRNESRNKHGRDQTRDNKNEIETGIEGNQDSKIDANEQRINETVEIVSSRESLESKIEDARLGVEPNSVTNLAVNSEKIDSEVLSVIDNELDFFKVKNIDPSYSSSHKWMIYAGMGMGVREHSFQQLSGESDVTMLHFIDNSTNLESQSMHVGLSRMLPKAFLVKIETEASDSYRRFESMSMTVERVRNESVEEGFYAREITSTSYKLYQKYQVLNLHLIGQKQFTYERLNFRVGIGATLNYFNNGDYNFYDTLGAKIPVSDYVSYERRLRFSGLVDCGFAYNITNHWQLITDLRYLSKVRLSESASPWSHDSYAWQARIGLGYRF